MDEDDLLCVDQKQTQTGAQVKPCRKTTKVCTSKEEADEVEAAFRKRQESWEQAFLLDKDQPGLGSWLMGQRVSSTSFVLTCVACRGWAQADITSEWVRGKPILKIADLKKEEDESGLHRAPDVAMIMDVWRKFKAGSSCRAVADTGAFGGRHKVERLHSCIGNACLEADRDALTTARVIAIHQDVRAGVLQIRFSATLADWSCLRGLLGLDCTPGTKSEDLQEATVRILSRFCGGDLRLMARISEKVEMIDADGASDEQRTLNLLSGRAGAVRSTMFPNIRIRVRDPTHCARRLSANPWAVDPYLSQTFLFYIGGAESMTHVIQHSPDLRHVFSENTCSVDSGTPLSQQTLNRMRCLDYAPHRFESKCKPLCRFVLVFESIWRTALDIMVRRAGTEPARKAQAFVEGADVESLLQLALLADAGLQSMELVRFYDGDS
ncbi:unnamed protein product [Symbiodinium sp. CCMP2592]|nr:unnamed protein product [Symbiodinium sp. CCMP2592]